MLPFERAKAHKILEKNKVLKKRDGPPYSAPFARLYANAGILTADMDQYAPVYLLSTFGNLVPNSRCTNPAIG